MRLVMAVRIFVCNRCRDGRRLRFKIESVFMYLAGSRDRPCTPYTGLPAANFPGRLPTGNRRASGALFFQGFFTVSARPQGAVLEESPCEESRH